MAWILLIIAGLLETAWAIALKQSDGFRRLIPSIFTIAALAGSMYLLSLAARSLPIGTAYAVWVGIGAAGTAILGVVLLNEPLTVPRCLFLVMLLVSIVGIQLTGQAATARP